MCRNPSDSQLCFERIEAGEGDESERENEEMFVFYICLNI